MFSDTRGCIQEHLGHGQRRQQDQGGQLDVISGDPVPRRCPPVPTEDSKAKCFLTGFLKQQRSPR